MKRLVVLGGGETGVGTAVLAQKKLWEVWLSDKSVIKSNFKERLEKAGIDWEEGGHSWNELAKADLVVKSPGIPEKAEVVQFFRKKNIPVISELDFAARYLTGKVIAITGSNGKTTTSMLIHYMLTKAGLDAALVGNVGNSIAGELATVDHDYWVVEVSSFQLDDSYDFRPDVAIITNITPDHLDRYAYKFELYTAAKWRIAQKMSGNDALVYCADDDVLTNTALGEFKPRCSVYNYTLNNNSSMTAYLTDDQIRIELNERVFEMAAQELSLLGQHNTQNSMAAAIVGLLSGLTNDSIRESLRSFKAVEHRLEEVAVYKGVRFVNDSKATNVNSTWYALESMRSQTVLILGGIDKGNDYELLRDLVREKVKAIVCLGKDNKAIIDAFGPMVDVVETTSANEAVNSAFMLAEDGDTVLLSPACASFDLFNNYEHRGKLFKEAVAQLCAGI